MMNRAEKFRQSAFAYLLVGVLYEGAAWAMWRRGVFPSDRGPIWLWMLLGAGIVTVVVWGLWKWQNVWFARVVWVVHAARIPALIGGAFFPLAEQKAPTGFYLTALVVVVINLWMLGRAAWDA